MMMMILLELRFIECVWATEMSHVGFLTVLMAIV